MSAKFTAVFCVVLLLIVLAVVAQTGCTAQERARNFGGTATENLAPGKKLVMITWKEDHLWILTRDRRPDENVERYEFKESSSYGVMQGTVLVVEH